MTQRPWGGDSQVPGSRNQVDAGVCKHPQTQTHVDSSQQPRALRDPGGQERGSWGPVPCRASPPGCQCESQFPELDRGAFSSVHGQGWCPQVARRPDITLLSYGLPFLQEVLMECPLSWGNRNEQNTQAPVCMGSGA